MRWVTACGLLILVLTAPSVSAQAPDVPPSASVQVGPNQTVVVRAAFEGQSPATRAAAAEAALAAALLDPTCDPERIVVESSASGGRIVACGHAVLDVGAEDAQAEGREASAVLAAWADVIRSAWTAEKTQRFSRSLVESAVLGLLYPIVFLFALWLVRLAVRRTRGAADRFASARGPKIERVLLGRLVGLGGWAVYLLLAYVFLIALFDRFPRTALWAQHMLEPLVDLAGRSGTVLLGLVPRVLLLLVVIVAARLALHALGSLFAEVRAKRLRLDPILTADTAGPAELTGRALVLGIAAFLGTLLVPGNAGQILLAAFAFLALALVLGARQLVENLIGGLVVIYGRPFRRGEAIRIAGRAGVVERKGFFHLALRGRDGQPILVPNREILLHDVRQVDAGYALRLAVTLEFLRENCLPEGLFRHAAAEAGLRREDGEVLLLGVENGTRVYRVRWLLPEDTVPPVARDAFLRALLAHAAGLGVRVASVKDVEAPAQ